MAFSQELPTSQPVCTTFLPVHRCPLPGHFHLPALHLCPPILATHCCLLSYSLQSSWLMGDTPCTCHTNCHLNGTFQNPNQFMGYLTSSLEWSTRQERRKWRLTACHSPPFHLLYTPFLLPSAPICSWGLTMHPMFPPAAACLNPLFWLGDLGFGLPSNVEARQ